MVLPLITLEQFFSLYNSNEDKLLSAIKYLPSILVDLSDQEEEGFNQVIQHIKELSEPFNFSVLLDVRHSDLAFNFLDIGIKQVIMWCKESHDLKDLLTIAPSFPKERFGCLLDYKTLKEDFLANLPIILPHFSTIGFHSNSVELNSNTLILQLSQSQNKQYNGQWLVQNLCFPEKSMLSQLKNNNIDAIIPAHQLTLDEITEEPGKDEKLNLAEAILAPVKSDREDQLISTCVVDQLGTCLGLVYSNYSSVLESLKTGQGVYFSRKRGLWHKGITSGSHQHLLKIEMDCDFDTLKFTVIQHGSGFCHLETLTCFGKGNGLVELERTIQSRKNSAPEGSYTHRLFTDPLLLNSKIMEEAEELCQAENKNDVAFEAADLMYFLMVKCAMVGSRLEEVLNNLQKKSFKVQRRAGDAKPKWLPKIDNKNIDLNQMKAKLPTPDIFKVKEPTWALPYQLTTYNHNEISENERQSLLKRPILNNKEILSRVDPILQEVRQKGDSAILEFTAKFDQVELEETCMVAPFPSNLMELSPETKQAIDMAYENILKFHLAQKEKDTTLEVETSNGVICTRFSRPIERVGLYIPGGTAVLPSTALMLGIPAKVAGCSEIVFATPPRKDGTIAPEVVYVAEKVGATHILKAGGAQAVAALAYGTNTVPKVDKICGPGNQYVTCAKMIVQNDPSNLVSIDMPAGPSEILVIADATSNPKFVASDLLSQAEHGEDSQSVLVTVGLDETKIQDILKEVESQAKVLPRNKIVEKSLAHSFLLTTENQEQAIAFSNDYAPEHLIIQTDEAHQWVDKIINAGSVFLGHYSPESCGDYASGTNHTLPTYGYARMHSGVGTSTFQKYITSQYITKEGIKALGPVVMHLAEVEGLKAHSNAVRVRLESLKEYYTRIL